MGKLEKTRDNINVEHLDNEQRKDLFNKFVQSGGQVITEKAKKNIKIDRSRQKELSQKMDEHQRKLKQQQTPAASFQRTSSQTSYGQVSYHNGFHVFWSRLRLFFMGVSTLNGEYFKKNFLEDFQIEYNTALIELQMIYLDLFKQFPVTGQKIIKQLDELRPLYYELLEMTGDLYDPQLSSAILERFIAVPYREYRVKDLSNPLISYFRKIYLLSHHIDTILFAFSRALEFQERLEKGKGSFLPGKRKKYKNALYTVFNKLYPRLYWLFCLQKGEIIPLIETKRMDDALSIKVHMKPGTRTENTVSTRIVQEKSTEPSSKPESEIQQPESAATQTETASIIHASIPDDVKSGYSLMDTVNFEMYRQEIKKDSFLRSINQNDRMFSAYILFLEFDREYSFILTTYKLKFTPQYSIRGKSDYRMRLSDIYNKMRPCYDSMKEYFLSLDIYEKARLDRPASQDQYFNYTKRLSDLDREKKMKARQVRSIIRTFLEQVVDEMWTLILDMDNKNEIIANPQDILDFDSPVEADLKLRSKKVYEAIKMVYSYASALSYRLSHDGDLYSDSDLSNTEQLAQTQPPSPPQPNASSTPVNTEQKSPEPEKQQIADKDNKKGSILGELDDLV